MAEQMSQEGVWGAAEAKTKESCMIQPAGPEAETKRGRYVGMNQTCRVLASAIQWPPCRTAT